MRISLPLALLVSLASCSKDVDDDLDGYVASEDCDDTDATVHPNADELCDTKDNDCDGDIDEEAVDALTLYADGDGDGYGLTDSTMMACEAMDGYSDRGDDCNDEDSGIYPGANEVCDGADNDCDTEIDEDATDTVTQYRDEDGDGYGDPNQEASVCDGTEGYSANMDDCDDSAETVYPGAPERCDDNMVNDCSIEFCDPDAPTPGCTLPSEYCGDLAISANTEGLELTWSSDCVLQKTNDLTSGSWSDFTAGITLDGCTRTATELFADVGYYRLALPK